MKITVEFYKKKQDRDGSDYWIHLGDIEFMHLTDMNIVAKAFRLCPLNYIRAEKIEIKRTS